MNKIATILTHNPPQIKLRLSHFMLVGSNIYICYEFYHLYKFLKANYMQIYMQHKQDIIIPFQNFFMEHYRQPFNLSYYLANGNHANAQILLYWEHFD